MGKEVTTAVALEDEVVVGLFADVTLGHKAMLKASRSRLSVSVMLLNMRMEALLSAYSGIDRCDGRRSVRSSHCDNGVQRGERPTSRAAAARLIDGRFCGRHANMGTTAV